MGNALNPQLMSCAGSEERCRERQGSRPAPGLHDVRHESYMRLKRHDFWASEKPMSVDKVLNEYVL